MVDEAALLRSQIAQAQRRRSAALQASNTARKELEALKAVAATPVKVNIQDLEVGSRVRVVGFLEVAQLSGQEAVVVSKDTKKSRCKVRFSGGDQRLVPISRVELIAGVDGKSLWQKLLPPKELPLLSPESLRIRSCLDTECKSQPCELWPFVFSGVMRAVVPDRMLGRLVTQLDAAALAAAASAADGRGEDTDQVACLLHGAQPGPQEVSLEQLDNEFVALLLKICEMLAQSIHGAGRDFTCELDRAWGVVQREGDYSPLKSFTNSKAPAGFACLMELQLPAGLSQENHQRPSKGAYGYHDGIHNLIWKADRAADRESLIMPGIIQLELTVGYLYVFPQWLQTLTWPFEGSGERKWLAAVVALTMDKA